MYYPPYRRKLKLHGYQCVICEVLEKMVTPERVKCSEGECTKKALVRENYFSIF